MGGRRGGRHMRDFQKPLSTLNSPPSSSPLVFSDIQRGADIMALALPRVRGSQRKSARVPVSRGLSHRLGVRVLLHRDLLTCRFLNSMPRLFQRHCYRTDQSHFSTALRDPCSAQTPVDGSSRTSRCASGMTVPPKGHNTQPAASRNATVSHINSSG